MSIYRECFLSESNNSTEFEELIENSFIFLNEDVTVEAIKKTFEELKDKDVSEIKKEDLEDLLKLLKQADANELAVGLGIRMIGWTSGAIMALIAYVTANDAPGKAILLSILGLLISTISTNSPMVIYKSYDKIIKLEANMNNKLKKLRALGNNEDKEVIKEIEKALKIIQKVKVEYKNNYRKSYNEDVDVMLEFKGNEDKTEAFKIIMDEMGDLCEYNLEKIRLIDKTIKEVERIIMTKETYKDLGTSLDKLTKIDKGLDKDVEKLAEELGINYQVSGEVFNRNLKKFTVKYSEVSMRDKEAMAEKLTKVVDKINNIMKYYNSKEFTKKCEELSDFATANDKTGNKFEKGVQIYIGLLKYLNQEAALTKQDVDYIIKALNVPKLKNSLIFKVLNPGFN